MTCVLCATLEYDVVHAWSGELSYLIIITSNLWNVHLDHHVLGGVDTVVVLVEDVH